MPFQEPPIGRGEVMASTDDGARWEGAIKLFDDIDYSASGVKPLRSNHKVKCLFVLNNTGAALLPKRSVPLSGVAAGRYGKEVADGYVEEGSGAAGAEQGYVVDEFLPSAGVADGEWFWLVIEGPTLALTSLAGDAENVISVNDKLVALTAATSQATTAGRVISSGGATSVLALDELRHIGRALSAKTTDNTNNDILVYVKAP